MQKIPCHCQTDAQQRVSSAPRCQISPWSIKFHEAVFVLSPPHTSLRHLFVRWCSWFNKVVFLLCWRPFLSTLCNPDQYIAKLHVDLITGGGLLGSWGQKSYHGDAKVFTEWSDSEKLKDQNCFILNRTVVSKIPVTLVNQQKIQQLRMFIIPVGKQTTQDRMDSPPQTQDKRKNRPADTCSPQPAW